MTEKEFLEECTDVDSLTLTDLGIRVARLVANVALGLAKQRGAKFDPEPTVIPKLKIHKLRDEDCYSIIIDGYRSISGVITSTAITSTLSYEQAEEVIRRCELVPKIRELLLGKWQGISVNELIDMIDGKELK